MTFSTEKLTGMGVKEISLKIDPLGGSNAAKVILARNGVGRNLAQPFTVYFVAYKHNGKQIGVIGRADGVLHRDEPARYMELDLKYHRCREVLFLNTIYVEDTYEGCGVATNVLERLPELVNETMNSTVGAILLTPIPQVKGPDGQIVQMPMGVDFMVKWAYLTQFYYKRGFRFLNNFEGVGKLVTQRPVLPE
jgi:GNAT superfamily N-acetyltransferase